MSAAEIELRQFLPGVPVYRGSYRGLERHHRRLEQLILAEHAHMEYRNGLNFPLPQSPPLVRLYREMLHAVRRLHRALYDRELILSPRNGATCWALVFDRQRPRHDHWHNHIPTCSYNSVYYLAAARDDRLAVRVPSGAGKERIVELPVRTGMLLTMPNWLSHMPCGIDPKRVKPRISLNIEIIAEAESWPEGPTGPTSLRDKARAFTPVPTRRRASDADRQPSRR